MAVFSPTYTSSHRASSITMIVLGVLAIILPLVFGIAIAILLGILVIFCGLAFLAYAFAARGAGSVTWRVLVGVAYLIGGVYLVFHPALSLISLTLLLAVVFLVEGIFELIAYFSLRGRAGSGWLLFDGLIALFLSILIWRNWPFSSSWLLGTLVGINLIVNGVTGLSHASASRRAIAII
jgi:uncharacterized membrane protein HdeD (DUF308 family)